jgi:adenylate kinase
MRLIVLGRQGAGKGTQCARLAERLGVVHVATGDAFRAAIAAESQLGREAARFVAAGELVPDDLAVEVVCEALERAAVQEKGFVLDGFPRTERQAQRLDALLAPAKIDVVVDLWVETDVVLRRLLSRRVCVDCERVSAAVPNSHGPASCARCGGTLARRADDTEPLIRRRLAIYEAEARPVLSWYASQGRLRTVDGRGHEELVARRIEAAIQGRPQDEGRRVLARLASELTPTILLDAERPINAGQRTAGSGLS